MKQLTTAQLAAELPLKQVKERLLCFRQIFLLKRKLRRELCRSGL